MEAENDEASKSHDNNTFSLHSILLIVQVSAALAVAGYFGFEGFILWFDWFRLVLRNIFFIFIILNVLIASIYFTLHKATEKKKTSLYDDYITPVPSVVRSSSPEQSFASMEVGEYVGGGGGYNYNNSSCYEECVQPFQAVEESSSCCYERVVMETSSKSCKKVMSSEKKMKKKKTRTVEYHHHQRTESERVMKTTSSLSSSRWQAMMDEMSGEEFRMTIDTFLIEKKKMMCGLRQNGVVDDHCRNGGHQLQNGVAYQWHNGFPQLQNGWQNGFPQLQNGGVHHWQNGFPQLQNGGFDENCVPQLQWQPDYDGTGSHGRRLVGGSGSTSGHGPFLAISN